MAKAPDVRVVGSTLGFLPVETRVPLKFGAETPTEVPCARVRLRACDAAGRTAEGWRGVRVGRPVKPRLVPLSTQPNA
jgi:hypothetical protein